jgi:hypothetical protein
VSPTPSREDGNIQVSETCLLEYRTMGESQKLSNPLKDMLLVQCFWKLILSFQIFPWTFDRHRCIQFQRTAAVLSQDIRSSNMDVLHWLDNVNLLPIFYKKISQNSQAILTYLFVCACLNYTLVKSELPVTVAERSKARTAFAHSEAGVVCSNPTQGMDV